MPKKVGRPPKPEHERAKGAGFVAYPEEIAAINDVADDLGFKSGFDYLRSRVIAHRHPKARGRITAPRLVG